MPIKPYASESIALGARQGLVEHGEWACDWQLSEGGLALDTEKLEDTVDVDARDLGWE